MSGFRRILVPVDFSEASREALAYASELALKFGASITLLNACEPALLFGPPEVPGLVTEALRAEEARATEAALAELRRLSAGLDPVNQLVRIGEASKVILDCAKDGGFDLIVMGTHGRTGLSHMMLGSIAERVLRRAPCPVLTVRAPKAHRAAA